MYIMYLHTVPVQTKRHIQWNTILYMKSYLIFYKLKFQQDFFCLKFQISVAEKRLIITKFKYRKDVTS